MYNKFITLQQQNPNRNIVFKIDRAGGIRTKANVSDLLLVKQYTYSSTNEIESRCVGINTMAGSLNFEIYVAIWFQVTVDRHCYITYQVQQINYFYIHIQI